MTKADPSSPGDAPQSTVEEPRNCIVRITCPPVPPTGTKVMLPNFRTTGNFACDHQQLRLIFKLTKGDDAYCAPDLAVIGPTGTWAQTGWFKCNAGPLGPPPPNGPSYTLTVTLEAFNNNHWDSVASDQCKDITIDNVNGNTCQ